METHSGLIAAPAKALMVYWADVFSWVTQNIGDDAVEKSQ